jgi:hypothetical protein
MPRSGSRIETFMGLPGVMLGFSNVEFMHCSQSECLGRHAPSLTVMAGLVPAIPI